MYISHSQAHLEQCQLMGNTAGVCAVKCMQSRESFRGLTSGVCLQTSGGAIRLHVASMTLKACTLSGNTAKV